jgi:hypothetical protein
VLQLLHRHLLFSVNKLHHTSFLPRVAMPYYPHAGSFPQNKLYLNGLALYAGQIIGKLCTPLNFSPNCNSNFHWRIFAVAVLGRNSSILFGILVRFRDQQHLCCYFLDARNHYHCRVYRLRLYPAIIVTSGVVDILVANTFSFEKPSMAFALMCFDLSFVIKSLWLIFASFIIIFFGFALLSFSLTGRLRFVLLSRFSKGERSAKSTFCLHLMAVGWMALNCNLPSCCLS